MLGRANQNYVAYSPAASASRPGQKTKLVQAFSPTSSLRNRTIAEYCKHTPPGTITETSRSSAVPDPRQLPTSNREAHHLTNTLNSRSLDVSADANKLLIKGSSSVATLCNKQDSFSDNSLVLTDLPASNFKIKQAEEADLLAYGIDLDDFTDDENLGLDFISPQALPAPQLNTNTEGYAENITGSQCDRLHSSLSWASSPPSHYIPPPSKSGCMAATLPKRGVPDHTGPPLPTAKKRTMPTHWTMIENSEATFDEVTTPAFKHKDVQPWDATPSVVKAQKKYLKDSSRKTAQSETGQIGREDRTLRTPDATVTSTRKGTTPATISLSSEQQHVKNLVCIKGASVFFTGPAGTGKSVLMRSIISDLRKKFAREPDKLGVTASTGLAACNIGGMTLHSFAGIGLGKEDVQILVKKIRRNPKAKTRWQKTKVLIIDEISMVDGDLFDKLSNVGRAIRNNGRPWGGIQLVLTGDFFQLPPVPDREKRDVKFAFEAATWNTSITHTIGLSEVFRQKDPEFANMLNEMRLGRISDATVRTFKSLSRPPMFDDAIEVTELFPTRMEVDNSNEKRLHALKGKSYRYDAHDAGLESLEKREKLLQNLMAPKSLTLREGAQVMLIKNMDETLVNGSVGTVVKFMTESEYAQFGEIDFESTADSAIKRSNLFNQFLNSTDTGPAAQIYPLVRFHAADGSQRNVLIHQEEWKVELPTGEVQASRHQLPLILAWALSIHKAQGQTLERVKVDLGRVFEKGQAYVALSRATTKDGLQVLRFEKHKVMAHPRVVGFYSKLYSAESAMKSMSGGPSILAFTRRTEPEPEPERTSVFAQRGGTNK